MPDQFSQMLEWRRNERTASGQLARLPSNFYTSTTAYLADLRRTYETELRENPSGRKGEIARQTYQRAIALARDIVEARADKVTRGALHASAGGARDMPNALPEEQELLAGLLGTVSEFRRSVAPYLEAAGAFVEVPMPRSAAAPAPEAPRPAAPPAPVWVRIVRDSRAITVGTETLELRKEDVLSLPPDTAELLVRAEIAQRVEPPAAHVT